MKDRLARLVPLRLVLIALVGCARTTEVTRDASPAGSAPAASVTTVASAAPATPIASGARFEEATQGAPFDIRLHKHSVIYCDKTSKHALKLSPNSGRAVDGFCGPPREPNTSCADVAAVTSVRMPGRGPDDVLDTAKGASVRLKGHVRDCAGVDSTVVVATSAGVIIVDTEKVSQTTLTSEDADRVALSPDWVAWTKGEKIFAQRR